MYICIHVSWPNLPHRDEYSISDSCCVSCIQLTTSSSSQQLDKKVQKLPWYLHLSQAASTKEQLRDVNNEQQLHLFLLIRYKSCAVGTKWTTWHLVKFGGAVAVHFCQSGQGLIEACEDTLPENDATPGTQSLCCCVWLSGFHITAVTATDTCSRAPRAPSSNRRLC